jgi:hypothetical protein
VLYHSGQTFGQVLCSCLDAFVVDASDYSSHLIRHLLNASEAFATEWFLRNKSKSGGLSQPEVELFPKLKKSLRGKSFRSIEEVSNEVTVSNPTYQQRRRPDRNTRLAQTLNRCDKAQWRLRWRYVNIFCKINSILKRKHTVCRTFEMTHVWMRLLVSRYVVRTAASDFYHPNPKPKGR